MKKLHADSWGRRPDLPTSTEIDKASIILENGMNEVELLQLIRQWEDSYTEF